LAAWHGHKEVVELLVAVNKIEINTKDKDGWTALMKAASNGHKEVVELLVAVDKVEINAQDKDGWTALMKAASNDHKNVVKLLRAQTGAGGALGKIAMTVTD